MSIQASRATVGIVVIALVGAFFWYMKRDASYANITSFKECAQAGYQTTGTSPNECRTPDGKIFTDNTVPVVATSTATSTFVASSSPATGNEDRIRVTNVAVNQKIASPLVVRGEARGSWYFEASFPVELFDGNGKQIAIIPAQALSEWMTNEFVPFSATLTFAKPSTATGTLRLHNDNPSGLPENDRWISIPVSF